MPSRPPRPLRTLLLDLDGTLLDFNMTDLLDGYFTMLFRRFGNSGSFTSFRRHMVGAVRKMMDNREPHMGLEHIFLDYLAPRLGRDRMQIKEVFRLCHTREFSELRGMTRPVPAAARLVDRAGQLGYDLGLATNPVFFLEAITARLDWAGIDPSSFSFISSVENMHFCKPHPEYFAEVLGNMDGNASESVMVGNDPVKDMPAASVGMFTYLVSARGVPASDGGADLTGKIEDVLSWIEERGPVI